MTVLEDTPALAGHSFVLLVCSPASGRNLPQPIFVVKTTENRLAPHPIWHGNLRSLLLHGQTVSRFYRSKRQELSPYYAIHNKIFAKKEDLANWKFKGPGVRRGSRLYNSKGKIHSPPVKNHSVRVLTWREKDPENPEVSDDHLDLTRRIYCQVTGNPWTEADLSTYRENRIAQIPTQRIISVIETVTQRSPTKINSFNCFVKEILAVPDPRHRA